MSGQSAAQVLLLTPPGRGAVACVRVEGPRATELVANHFRSASGRKPAEQPIGKVLFGTWGAETGEGLIVARRSETAWEIHCHGGPAAVSAIVEPLVAAGCQRIAWTDWLNQTEPDPLRAEARRALAEARTERAARVLLDQYHGALRRAVEKALAALARHDAADALQQVRVLIQRSALGAHLVAPWRVVLAGRPNVGKSSLVNALVGYPRSIVYDQPGTTRDLVTAGTAIDGWPVELTDTAGLRASAEPIESEGIARTQSGLARADLIVLVFDVSAAWTDEDAALVERWPHALRVFNKQDLCPSEAGFPCTGIATSAPTGAGVERLLAEIGRALVADPPQAGEAVPFTARQTAALTAAREALEAERPERAELLLRSLFDTGR